MLSFFIAAALAATLDVQIERGSERAPLDISIGLRTDDEPQWVDARHLGADESTVTFTRLDRGTYVVLIRGAEPMQRATANVNLGSGDTRRVSIALRPGRVRARVRGRQAAAQREDRVRFVRRAVERDRDHR